ncbi:MAG TPA: hypothetical protein ENG86_10915 [Nitrospirae bacterium]|nr:hypothetical protein [Nitrospirota bacterium]
MRKQKTITIENALGLARETGAAGRHLDAPGVATRQLRGLMTRRHAAAGTTQKTPSVAIVVPESTGEVTISEKGHIATTLEPVISRRLV